MSPAFVNRFSWYRKLPGNRQVGRSIHFLVLCAYIAFVIAHVTMVVVTGFARNMNHIVIGTDNPLRFGMYIGLTGLVILFMANVMANWATWLFPRAIQRIGEGLVNPVLKRLLAGHAPKAEYRVEDISPFLWPNGKLPTSDEWRALASNNFKDYRLKVYGLVENPVDLSLEELKALGKKTQITLHHCIQGWSGIAEWGGVPIRKLVERVKPKPEAQVLAFFSFGYSLYGKEYYDTQSLENVLKAECILALEMNGAPLTETYGSPLRLRVENQLGYKMVKWIERIEFVASEKDVGKGEGGSNEDDEYFDLLPNI